MGILKYKIIVMMRRLISLLLLGILSFVLVIACTPTSSEDAASSSSATAECRTIQHEFGETQICGQPQRIIAFDPPALDMLLSLDVQPIALAGIRSTGYSQDQTVMGSPQIGAEIAGVNYFSDRLTSRPIYIGTTHTPSLESILRLKPDLIISRYVNRTQYATISKIAPVLPLNSNSADWQQDFLILAHAINRESQGQQVIERYQQKIAEARTTLQITNRDTKALILDMPSLNSITAISNDNYIGVLLEQLGFQLIVPQSPASSHGIEPISLEYLPETEPDLIIVLERGSLTDPIKQQWNQNPILQSVANQADQLVFADFYLWATLEGPISAEHMIEDIQRQLNL